MKRSADGVPWVPWVHGALFAALLSGGTACGSSAPETRTDEVVPASEEAVAWFGVRGTKCDAVLPALGLAAALREGAVSPWRVADETTWCTVGPTEAGANLRIDSVAQRVSASLERAAIAFYVARGAWSYTVFEGGEPVLSLESHLGRPLLSGDAVRGAAILGVELAVVSSTAEAGQDLTKLGPFVKRIGVADPGADARRVEARTAAVAETTRTVERTLSRIPAGSWAALPPLGVVLVKAVELRKKDEEEVPTYVIVDDMTTLVLPVARAEAMGMRPVASVETANKVLKLIDDGVDIDDATYDAGRMKRWLDAMRIGELERIAQVFAGLCEIQDKRKLVQVEAGLMETSREWLAEEIAAAKQVPLDGIDAKLRDLCD